MSQTDMDVANASGAVVRADINAHLDALVTLSSGATAPTTTFAHMWWYDTANDILNRRNAANSAWIIFLQPGTFTPSLTFSTPGDLTVVHSSQTGRFTIVEDCLFFHIKVATSTFTHTTATGTLDVTGLPVISATGLTQIGAIDWKGLNHANALDDLTWNIASAATKMRFIASRDNTSSHFIDQNDAISGDLPTFFIQGFYYI